MTAGLYLNPTALGGVPSIPSTTELNLSATDFTIEVDLEIDDVASGTTQTLASKDNVSGNGRSWSLSLTSGSAVVLDAFRDDGSYVGQLTLGYNLSVHVADTERITLRVQIDYDNGASATNMEVFVNDVSKASGAVLSLQGADVLNPDGTAAVTFGDRGGGSTLPTVGTFYSVKMWTELGNTGTPIVDIDFTKLTAAEIEAASFTEDSANAATVTINGDEWAYGSPVTSIAGKVPELYLDMEDGYAHVTPTWFDRAGNNHHGQWGSAPGANTNEPIRKYFAGTKYIWLPGSASNSLSVPDIGAYGITNDLDLRCRVSIENLSAYQYLIAYQGGATTGYALLIKSDGELRFDWAKNDGTARSVSTVAAGLVVGNTYDIRVTWTQAGAITAYVDGSSVFTTSNAAYADGGKYTATTPVYLGMLSNGTGNPLFGGLRSAQIYDGIDGTLVLDVNLADAVTPYATFTERSSNAATVTINRSSSGYVSTVIDKTMALFSTDDYVEVPDDAGLQFAAGESLTIIGVGQLSGVSTSAMQLAGTMPFPLTGGYSVSVAGSGAIRFNIADINPTVALDDGVAPTVLVWQTYAGVRNVSGDDIEVFVDGVGTGSPTTDNTTATLDGGNVFRIGALADVTPSNHWEGSISKVVLFREALTDAEVLAVSNALILDKSGAQTLHDDALMRWILDNDDYGSSIELVGRLNERNATSGIEMEEARTDYLAG